MPSTKPISLPSGFRARSRRSLRPGKAERLHERALEPISQCLIRDLIVPNVYWEVPWPADGKRVDLLLIDRAGSGPVHVVEIKVHAADAVQSIPQVQRIPAHYRWIAFFAETLDAKTCRQLANREILFPVKNTPGCVGVIEVVRMSDDTLGANILVRAEMFVQALDKDVAAFKKHNKPTIRFDDD
jgi:hypothetical protein